MTILMLMVIILSTITCVVNARTSKVVEQLGPTQWVQVYPISFKYDEFSTNIDIINSQMLAYDATIDNDTQALQFPSLSSTIKKTKLDNCLGQVIYSKSIPLRGLDPKTGAVSGASFSTFFSFSLSSSIHRDRDHFIFFLMADPTNLSGYASTSYPHALTLNNAQPPLHSIAVGYDLWLHEEFNDSNNNHIDSDIHSVLYLARINPFMLGVSWSEGKLIYSWIDYDDSSKELEVRNSDVNSKPHKPVAQISIDLTFLYSDLMYVGFRSPPKFNNANKILIHSWSFETHYQPWNPGDIVPTPSPSPLELSNYNKSIEAKAIRLGEILGTTLGAVLLIMLICAVLVAFSQFGFSCVVSPEELIELEFTTLEEYAKGKVEEEVECKCDSSTKNEEPQNSGTKNMEGVIKKETKKIDLHENEEDYLFRRGSLWGDALDHHTGLKEDTLRVIKKTQPNIHEGRQISKFSILSMVCGKQKSSTSVKEAQNIPTILSTQSEKEQIAILIKEATQKEENVEATRYQYKELSEATNSFGSSNKLGGNLSENHATYRGYLPISSTEIVVKVLNIELLKTKSKDIRVEMSLLSKLQHPNLVKLLGWCKHKGRFYIVYELALGQSLDRIIFGNDRILISYPWKKRFTTIKALASALHYLHEGWQLPIIHKNVKSNNVIIDTDQANCKLGDYGLSCLIDINQIEPPKAASSLYFQDTTKYGYLAPEFAKSKIGTKYTDVYSFGILCLEIVCQRQLENRQKAPEEQFLVEWLLHLAEEDKLTEAIGDKALLEIEIQQILLVLSLSLMCVDLLPEGRPTMKQVIKCLSGEVPFPLIPILETMDTLTSSPQVASEIASISTPKKHILNNDNNSAPAANDFFPVNNILFETKNDFTPTGADPISLKNTLFEVKKGFAPAGKNPSSLKSILTDNDSTPSRKDLISQKNKLFETKNEWTNVDFFVRDQALPFQLLSKTKNSWVEILVEMHDTFLFVNNYRKTYLPPGKANNSWVDIETISFNKMVSIQHQSSSDLRTLQTQVSNSWAEIPNVDLAPIVVNKSLQPNKPTHLEWVDGLDVFNSTWTHVGSSISKELPALSLQGSPKVISSKVSTMPELKFLTGKLVEPISDAPIAATRMPFEDNPQKKSKWPPPSSLRPLPSLNLLSVEKIHPHRSGSNLPPIWPLPIPKPKSGYNSQKEFSTLKVTPHSLPPSKGKGTQVGLVSPSISNSLTLIHGFSGSNSETSTIDLEDVSRKLKYQKESFLHSSPNHGSQSSLPSTPPAIDLEALSKKLRHLKENFLQKNLPSLPDQPSSYGNRIFLSPSAYMSDRFDLGSSSNLASGSPLSGTPIVNDLKGGSNKMKYSQENPLHTNPPSPHLSFFSSRWPIPLPKPNNVDTEPNVLGTQEKKMVKKKRANQ